MIGHPKCRAFLTHGGLNSLQEAIYHAIPVLGLPFGTDQILNVGRAVKEGYALTLNWKDVRRDNLAEALQDLLYNATYNETKKQSINNEYLNTLLLITGINVRSKSYLTCFTTKFKRRWNEPFSGQNLR